MKLKLIIGGIVAVIIIIIVGLFFVFLNWCTNLLLYSYGGWIKQIDGYLVF